MFRSHPSAEELGGGGKVEGGGNVKYFSRYPVYPQESARELMSSEYVLLKFSNFCQ